MMRISFLGCLVLLPVVVFASVPSAYRVAGNKYQIPSMLLYAIACQEATRRGYAHPWPWTANIAGKAYYFDSRTALYGALKKVLDKGHKNFDVGLMEINWGYNAGYFGGDLWAATDPYQNIDAGAQHLKSLKDKHGTFEVAVGIYHAGEPDTLKRRQRATNYRERVRNWLALNLKRSS
ncbi:MAG: lytic transglycosylase [Thiothrix sp.]|nr:MAG: lytic transglycosylase [Thiothrix sp.]